MGGAVRSYGPVIDGQNCNVCAVCIRGCPAEIIPAQRKEKMSLRGHIYQKYYKNIKAAPLANLEKAFDWPACQKACPLKQDIKEYVFFIAHRKYREALESIRKTNALPSVTGYVCNHPCEMECLRCGVDESISIKGMKRFVADWDHGALTPPDPVRKNERKVVIIGSGPAGLAAAYDLARGGYPVEIIEALPEPGGLLAWAIPAFRLPRNILSRDIRYLEKMGINIRTSVKFGVDLTLAGLKNSGVDAVILAIGTHQALTLGIKNEGKVNGYFDCLTFLRKYAKNEPMDLGDQVIVIGGGYAAIDAARVAIRSGAKDVSIFYRRGPDEMPAKNEVKEGEEEGVRVNYLAAPTMLIVKNGQIQGLEFIRTKLGETDESGRKTAVPIKGSELVVKASSIISAVGQQPDFSWNQEDLTFQLSPRNTFIVDADGATNMEGVFAAGDAVNGPTTIVEAMANGRRAAQGVEAYLSRKD